jgi:nucleoid-associated protein YgaU
MTRENKLALVIGFGLMLFVGILVSDHFSAQRFDPATVAQKDQPSDPAAPAKLDEVAPGTLVAGKEPVDLSKDGTSLLPEAPTTGEALPVDGTPVKVEIADASKADGTPVRFHKVQKGETFWSIAAREYGDGSLATKLQDYNKAVSPDAVKLALNSDLRIPPIEVLKPGAVAKVPAGTSTARDDSTKTVMPKADPKAAARVASTYQIQKGDTPYAIARKQGIKVAELLNYNGIKDPSALKPGQTLKIPVKQ